jgi:hypothetical protein
MGKLGNAMTCPGRAAGACHSTSRHLPLMITALCPRVEAVHRTRWSVSASSRDTGRSGRTSGFCLDTRRICKQEWRSFPPPLLITFAWHSFGHWVGIVHPCPLDDGNCRVRQTFMEAVPVRHALLTAPISELATPPQVSFLPPPPSD